MLTYDGSNIAWQSEDTLGTQVLMTVPVVFPEFSFSNQLFFGLIEQQFSKSAL